MASKFSHFGFTHFNSEYQDVYLMPDRPDDTLFDGYPGWSDLLLKFCEKLKALFEFYHMDANKDFHILQVKEKFGAIRIYYEPTKNQRLNDRLTILMSNLEAATRRTCFMCGKPATCDSKGWILPYCTQCAVEDNNKRNANHKTHFRVDECFRFY